MDVLITGGSGFIGSHLAEQLVSQGHAVHCIDDLSTGRISNLDACKGNPLFSYTIDSIFNESLTAELIDRCDYIVHLAAAVGVELIIKEPVKTLETNVKGTEIVLKHAAKKNKPVLIASTSEVYGKSDSIPFKEDGDIVLGTSTRCRWGYGCSKAMDEFLAFAYHKERGLPALIVRLFNTIGPRQTGRYGMVVPRFISQALSGGPLSIFGSGEQTRSFCHVSDTVRYLAALMKKPEAAGQIFNVGNDREISINNLAALVQEVLGISCGTRHIPYDQAYSEGFEDMMRRVPSIEKVSSLCGFMPQKTLEETIMEIKESG